MFIDHPLDDSFESLDSFVDNNKSIICSLWNDAISFIPGDDYDERMNYFTTLGTVVAICVYAKIEHIEELPLPYNEEQEDEVADLAVVIVGGIVMWDLAKSGLVENCGYGTWKLTEKGNKVGKELKNNEDKEFKNGW